MIKKTFITFILVLIYMSMFSQKDTIYIELKPDTNLIATNFICKEVIDATSSKGNLGYFKRGIGNKLVAVQFINGFNKHLKETISKLENSNNKNHELVLIFRDFTIIENIGTQNQYGYCNVEIEFARKKDSALYSLGIFSANIAEHAMNIKYTHEERVFKALKNCLIKFNQSNWKNNYGSIIKDIRHNTLFDYTKYPPKGAYMNFNQMARRQPIDSVFFNIKPTSSEKDSSIYSLNLKNKDNIEQIQFISDGKNIYMHSNRNQFLKSKSYGKYIYFEGKIPTTFNTAASISAGIVIGFAGGLVGGAVFAIASSTTKTNTKLKAVIIETENGDLKMLTDMVLHRITRPYPELLREYRKSKRKLADKEKVILELNKRF